MQRRRKRVWPSRYARISAVGGMSACARARAYSIAAGADAGVAEESSCVASACKAVATFSRILLRRTSVATARRSGISPTMTSWMSSVSSSTRPASFSPTVATRCATPGTSCVTGRMVPTREVDITWPFESPEALAVSRVVRADAADEPIPRPVRDAWPLRYLVCRTVVAGHRGRRSRREVVVQRRRSANRASNAPIPRQRAATRRRDCRDRHTNRSPTTA